MKRKWISLLGDALALAGAAAVCVGVWLIFAPAGVICAGAALILTGLLLERGAEGGGDGC